MSFASSSMIGAMANRNVRRTVQIRNPIFMSENGQPESWPPLE
jgi:hypothetical protein